MISAWYRVWVHPYNINLNLAHYLVLQMFCWVDCDQARIIQKSGSWTEGWILFNCKYYKHIHRESLSPHCLLLIWQRDQCDPRLCRFPQSENHEGCRANMPQEFVCKAWILHQCWIWKAWALLQSSLGHSCQINTLKSKTFNVNSHNCGKSKISCDATKAEISNYGFDGTTQNRLGNNSQDMYSWS